MQSEPRLYIFLASCKRFFNSGFYLPYIIICTHYWIPYSTHIEGIWSVQVGLKMAAMRPKHVAMNH